MTRIVLAMCFTLMLLGSAKAVECKTSRPGANSYWSWRLIDGRQCWYKGMRRMDKSLLHWSAAHHRSSKLATTAERYKDVPPTAERAPIPVQLQQMLPILPAQPTFEDRWRLR